MCWWVLPSGNQTRLAVNGGWNKKSSNQVGDFPMELMTSLEFLTELMEPSFQKLPHRWLLQAIGSSLQENISQMNGLAEQVWPGLRDADDVKADKPLARTIFPSVDDDDLPIADCKVEIS